VFLLDKINIDYPIDYRESPDDVIVARYGKARYGQARYVSGVFSLIINVATNWKILNRSISVKQDEISFKIREI